MTRFTRISVTKAELFSTERTTGYPPFNSLQRIQEINYFKLFQFKITLDLTNSLDNY